MKKISKVLLETKINNININYRKSDLDYIDYSFNNRFDSDNFTKINAKNMLKEFFEVCDIRYLDTSRNKKEFDLFIESFYNNFKKKLIKETSPGRNYRSVPDNGGFNISPDRVIKDKGICFEKSICQNTGKDIVATIINNKVISQKSFNDTESADLYIQQISHKLNINL